MAILNKKKKDINRKKPDARFDAGVLKHMRITEKSADAGKQNKYTFLVSSESNKPQVRQAVQGKYGVSVLGVHIVMTPGKIRRRGRQIGHRAGFKKAIVTLQNGQSIEAE